MKFKVTEKAMRPASDKRECFYCNQAIGEDHLDSCVLVVKTIPVEVTFSLNISVPASWNTSQVENHYNLGTYCIDNFLEKITEKAKEQSCSCDFSSVEVVGDTKIHYLDEG